MVDEVQIAGRGDVAWLTAGRDEDVCGGGCPVPVERVVVALTPAAAKVIPIAPGGNHSVQGDFQVTSDGRFATISLYKPIIPNPNRPLVPTQVVDRLSGFVESLPELEPGCGSGLTQISDDGRLLALQCEAGGWHELVADPPA